MASIVDVDNAPGNLEELEQNLSEAVLANQKSGSKDGNEGKSDPAPKSGDPLAGTKFEGKSVEEILESYNNLQSAYGRMANDLGTQRKLTDRLLDLKRDEDLMQNTPEKKEEPLPEISSSELLDNPTSALDRVMAAREARIRQEYDQRLSQFEQQLRTDKFVAKHPDYLELGQSEEFRAWATGDPIRNQVAQRAAQGDFDAADALLTEYKKSNRRDSSGNNLRDNDMEEARRVGMESSNTAGAANTGKVYRRADLIDLKINKPHIYSDPAFQAEILKAYSEGRVK